MNQTCSQHYTALHQIPELDDHMIQTKDYILKHLPSCFLVQVIEHGGILAYMDQQSNKTIAFRAETDALAIQETTNLPYSSKTPHHMHACGHDAHMAILLALAQWIEQHPPSINLLLIFEYAEETTGGANTIIHHPFFQNHHPQAIYALHLWPFLPAHTLASRPNTLMGYSCETNILIHGSSSHVSMFQQGIDAIEIAGHYLSQTVIPFENFLIRFGQIQAGHTRNVLANQASLSGTIRALETDTMNLAKQYLWQLATLFMMRYENIIEVNFNDGYPAVNNDPKLFQYLQNIEPNLQILPTSSYATESFSYYQKYVPGVFILLGTGNNIPLHSSNFHFPIEILETGLQFYQRIIQAKEKE